MSTRREFLHAALSSGGATLLFGTSAFAGARARPVLEPVAAACKRLAAAGWRELLQKATGGALDIGAKDLAAEFAKTLSIDRSVAGFADFAAEGNRAIEPGQPARSLLYHAFASPDVVAESLMVYPTLAEIEAVENYVYAARASTLAVLKATAGDREIGVVMFALQYRPARDTVGKRHADLVFSRTGISRMGTIAPQYDARARNFRATDPAKPYDFPAIPQRFAPFLAERVPGNDARLAVLDPQKGDAELQFWLPLHKLFDGDECLAGLELGVDLASGFRNDKLRRFHRYLQVNGYPTEWSGDDLEQFPFVIRDAQIASLSDERDFGSGVLEPRAAPFVNRARYEGEFLSFTVPPDWVATPGVVFFSSAQILGGEADTAESYAAGEYTYLEGAAPDYDRNAPEYVSIRHQLRDDGTLEDLNTDPQMSRRLREGGHKAQHFIDYAGDGWIEARVSGLDDAMLRVPAYAPVSPPDFFPQVSQHDLTTWWRNEVPKALRDGLWALPPYALSGRRMAPNIELPIGFSIYDTSACAVVGSAQSGAAPAKVAAARASRYSGLPDHSPGIFDPGWDASQGLFYNNPEENLQKFLQNHGLGTPFVEDVKLCAALGSYWPAIAPDSTRTFTPLKRAPGFLYPWPTIVPLTDAETGIEPVDGQRYQPWDGVRGPRVVESGGRRLVEYADIERVDYIAMPNTMTIAQLAKVDLAETKARVLAMASVYWALGIHDPDFRKRFAQEDKKHPYRSTAEILKAKAGWAVLSFRAVRGDEPELAEAQKKAGAKLAAEPRFRFHVYRWGEQTPHPTDQRLVQVSIREEAIAFVDAGQVLIKRGSKPWTRDASMPRS